MNSRLVLTANVCDKTFYVNFHKVAAVGTGYSNLNALNLSHFINLFSSSPFRTVLPIERSTLLLSLKTKLVDFVFRITVSIFLLCVGSTSETKLLRLSISEPYSAQLAAKIIVVII